MPTVSLRLYIAGENSCSQRALEAVRQFCDRTAGAEVRVVDVLQHPHVAEEQRVIATPTLELQTDSVCRRVVGDFSDPGDLAARLGFPENGDGSLR